MKPLSIGPMSLSLVVEKWPLTIPFRITGHTFDVLDVLVVSLGKDGHMGWGEAAGVYYRGDNPASMIKQIELLRPTIESGISRDLVEEMLPAGGARNALDCALWDLESKLTGCPAWQLADLDVPRPLLTTFGCGADTPERMATVARSYIGARAVKLKLTGNPIDAERVAAVREARPDVWLSVDANQGFTRSFLEQLMPELLQARVSLIEQPFPVGQETLLDGFQSAIPIAADESAQSVSDVSALAGRFNVINIKLDKCGGVTQALAMARTCSELGLGTMIGNMIGTSLAMAPAFLVGQLCDMADLDGPLFLKSDRSIAVHYADGLVVSPEPLWGSSGSKTNL